MHNKLQARTAEIKISHVLAGARGCMNGPNQQGVEDGASVQKSI